MGLSRDVIAALSAELMSAQETRTPVVSIAERYHDLTLGDAYEIQLQTLKRRIAAGACLAGAKVGFTSRATQQ